MGGLGRLARRSTRWATCVIRILGFVIRIQGFEIRIRGFVIRIQGVRIIQGWGRGNLALEALLEVVPVRLVFLLPLNQRGLLHRNPGLGFSYTQCRVELDPTPETWAPISKHETLHAKH